MSMMKLKIRRSPPRGSSGSKANNDKGKEALNFTTDMKKHGIMADIQGVQETKKKLIIKQRHISPPPYLTSGETEQRNDKDAENLQGDSSESKMMELKPGDN